MIFTIFIALFSLMALIVTHEFGHFILAKKFGTEVEEFGIGYPPRIAGKKIGGTTYSLNLIPFGAFVKIKGEEGGVENYRSFTDKPIWQRISIVLGGVVSFWIISVILLTIVAGVWGLPTAVQNADNQTVIEYKVSPWWQAPVQGIAATADITTKIVEGWGMGIKSLLHIEKLPEGVKMEMMGPLGIVDWLGQYSQMGLNYFLFFVALIANGLALANLLPIPSLDGGKMVFLLIEWLRGRAVNYKIEQKITAAFFVSLILLMIFITVKFDIPRIF